LSAAADLAGLPRAPQVGDRVKLRDASVAKVAAACAAAGYDCDVRRIVTITREDDGGGRRLWFDGAPHCWWAQDCELAWNSPEERRAALRAKGWRV
jgi:hypothetical protein